MSNPRAKAERSLAKDIRQGVVEQRPLKPKARSSKGGKPWKLEWTVFGRAFVSGSYKTQEQAEEAKARQERKGLSGLRVFLKGGEKDAPEK